MSSASEVLVSEYLETLTHRQWQGIDEESSCQVKSLWAAKKVESIAGILHHEDVKGSVRQGAKTDGCTSRK